MQFAKRVGHATPVCLRLGRSALHVFHHHQTVHEEPAVSRRDRHWNAHACTFEVLDQLGFPFEVGVGPAAEATDRDLPVNANAPHVVGNSTRESFDANRVFAPVPECFPLAIPFRPKSQPKKLRKVRPSARHRPM